MPLFILSMFFAACPVLSATSSALSAASEKLSASPAPESSYFHPKIAPKAFVTFVTKLITTSKTELSAFTNGLKALINAPPITLPSCSNDCFKILIWFAHESAYAQSLPALPAYWQGRTDTGALSFQPVT